MEHSLETDLTLVDETSATYCGQWRQLVSTTNWEKGRIILEWRQALIAAGAVAAEYSDEAWSSRVGGVTSQHVGRLRRVYERFGQVFAGYAGLFWSHFQTALDWPDAEMWLEGAVQSNWSISKMREQRWEALGAPSDQKPRDEDVISVEIDEDAVTADNAVGRIAAVQSLDNDTAKADSAAFDDTNDTGDAFFDDSTAAVETEEEPAAPFRPFAHLPPLPDDLTEAFESFKLAILRHKLSGWSEVSRDDTLAALDALKALTTAPSN